jgi:hypothetical protein
MTQKNFGGGLLVFIALMGLCIVAVAPIGGGILFGSAAYICYYILQKEKK